MLSSNETRALIPNLPNNAQLEDTPTPTLKLHPGPMVHAVVWECGKGQKDSQTNRHTDGHDQYTFCLGYASHVM